MIDNDKRIAKRQRSINEDQFMLIRAGIRFRFAWNRQDRRGQDRRASPASSCCRHRRGAAKHSDASVRLAHRPM